MRASSKHITFASPVFRAMLQHNAFQEGLELEINGTVEISLPEDDPKAFEVLLNIIHGKLSKVPRQIDIELFTSIIVLIDKYQFQEATSFFSDHWFDDLKSTIPDTMDQTVLPWLCVCWVLRKSEEFTAITKLAMWESDDKFGRDEIGSSLPISKTIIGKIISKLTFGGFH